VAQPARCGPCQGDVRRSASCGAVASPNRCQSSATGTGACSSPSGGNGRRGSRTPASGPGPTHTVTASQRCARAPGGGCWCVMTPFNSGVGASGSGPWSRRPWSCPSSQAFSACMPTKSGTMTCSSVALGRVRNLHPSESIRLGCRVVQRPCAAVHLRAVAGASLHAWAWESVVDAADLSIDVAQRPVARLWRSICHAGAPRLGDLALRTRAVRG